jgi:hypothetical protein
LLFELILDHQEIFATVYDAVKILVSVVMDDRSCASIAHPEVCFMHEISEGPTQQTGRNLGKLDSMLVLTSADENGDGGQGLNT